MCFCQFVFKYTSHACQRTPRGHKSGRRRHTASPLLHPRCTPNRSTANTCSISHVLTTAPHRIGIDAKRCTDCKDGEACVEVDNILDFVAVSAGVCFSRASCFVVSGSVSLSHTDTKQYEVVTFCRRHNSMQQICDTTL